MSTCRPYVLSGSWYSNSSQHNKQQQRLQQHCYSSKTIYFRGKGQKRELPVVSWPESGGQKYEGSKHSIWAHVIGQHYLPPISGRTPTGTSPFSLLWSAPTRLWPHFVAFRCSSPVHSIWPAWRRTTTQIPRPDDVGAGGKRDKGDVGSGHLGIPPAVNEAVQPPTIRNLNKN